MSDVLDEHERYVISAVGRANAAVGGSDDEAVATSRDYEAMTLGIIARLVKRVELLSHVVTTGIAFCEDERDSTFNRTSFQPFSDALAALKEPRP